MNWLRRHLDFASSLGRLPSRRRLVLALTMGLLLAMPGVWVDAHPPKPKRRQATPSLVVNPISATPAAVSELDRQQAYFQFEFLASLAASCPLPIQQRIVQQLVAEHRLATQSPQALSLEQLRSDRDSLRSEWQRRLATVSATWTADQLAWNGPPPPVTIARGQSRFVIVELHNATATPLNVSAKCLLRPESPPATVHPGLSQPFLVELGSDETSAELQFAVGAEQRTLTLQTTIVPSAKLRGRMLDGPTSAPIAGRVWVESSDGQMRRSGPFADQRSFLEKPILELPVMRMAAVPFFYADGRFEIDLPPGPTTVTFERGFEHPLVTKRIDLQPGETREVTLASDRLIDARSLGWVSGDTHLHWVTNAWNVDLPLADLALVQRAEDLRVANNLTLLHRTTTDAFIKPSQAAVGPIAAYSDHDYHIEMAEEYRNQNLYGHLCFLNLHWLVLPIGTGPQIAGDDSLDFPLNKSAIIEARSQGGISIEAHGTGANHELPLNAVHGLTDSLDQIDPDDYYRLLDCGFQLPLTNGSDHPARIAGCARAYVQMNGDFDYEKWIDGIRCGRTFTTSGPLLFLSVDGQGPGTVLTPYPQQPHLTARLHAVSRFPLGTVQLVSNGTVLHEVQTSERELTFDYPIPAGDSRWIIARCSRNEHWNPIWHPDIAHTSAVYIYPGGRPVFREAAAAEWIDRMRLHARDILTKGQFANALQRAAATQYVEESIQRYEQLIAAQRSIATEQNITSRRNWLQLQAAFASPRAHDPEFLQQLADAEHSGHLSAAVRPLTLLRVHINPESRAKLAVITPPHTLVQHRTQRFLVEVHNEAGIQAPLRIQAFDRSLPQTGTTAHLKPADWCSVRLLDNLCSRSVLSGNEYEWKLLELRCAELGFREIHLQADVGQGTQDLGFRSTADLLVKCVSRREHRPQLEAVAP